MITIFSKEGKNFQFNKEKLIEKCTYFKSAYNLQKENNVLQTDIYTFDRFSNECIKSLYKFIKKGKMNKKVILSEEFELLIDYVSCFDLKYEYECKKEIEPLLPFFNEGFIQQYKNADTYNFLHDKLNNWYKQKKKLYTNCDEFKNDICLSGLDILSMKASLYFSKDDVKNFLELFFSHKILTKEIYDILLVLSNAVKNKVPLDERLILIRRFFIEILIG